MKDEKKPSLAHLEWLIESRNENNRTALKLLSLFEDYPSQIRTSVHSPASQKLVAVAFSLWRAAFLSDTTGTRDRRIDNAENFLRKMLADNTIGFSQDIQWREWTVNFYLASAQFNLEAYAPQMKIDLGNLSPSAGPKTSKTRWTRLHSAFEVAVDALERALKAMPDDSAKK